ASLAVGRSIRKDHGLLSHAARSRGAAIGHLCRVLEKETCGRNTCRPHLHPAGCVGNDCSELVVCCLRQPSASQQCSVCPETRRAWNYWSRSPQTWPRIDPKLLSRGVADRCFCGSASCGHQLHFDPALRRYAQFTNCARVAQPLACKDDITNNDRWSHLAPAVFQLTLVSNGLVVLQDWIIQFWRRVCLDCVSGAWRGSTAPMVNEQSIA